MGPRLTTPKLVPQSVRPEVTVFARARLPTVHGVFELVSFADASGRKLDDVALVYPASAAIAAASTDTSSASAVSTSEVPTTASSINAVPTSTSSAADDRVAVRVHSECLTGDVFGSRRCDCGPQLQSALAEIVARGAGVLVYMRQEGRGIGIASKVAAYALQDAGMDTVEANLHLGFDDDLRQYDLAAAILRALEISRVELFTNNLRKVEGLQAAGLDVVRRLPLVTAVNADNARYLRTKRVRSGHLLGDDD